MEKYFLTVLVLMMCNLCEANNFCTSDETVFDTTCPTDCSQQPPRITGDKVFFNCSIGSQKDVDRYRKTHAADFLPKSTIFDAPKIKGVELYWKSYHFHSGPHFELAMKFNFSLPKGKIYEKPECSRPLCWRLPKAVLLTYESIPGPYGDSYYVNCSREKIFEFKFVPIHSYDIMNPRQLMDDCFVGLDVLKDKLVYNITLQTAEGKRASYITTVKVRPYSSQIWHPVIMTHLNETDGTLYTVIEKPPSTFNIQSYNVSLVVGENRILRSAKIMVRETNSTQFDNLTRGQYKIKVQPLCNGSCNKTVNVVTESYRIDMLLGAEKDYPHYLEESLEPVKIAAMVIGCIFGFILGLTIAYCIRKRPKCQENCSGICPSGLLLHSFERECETIIKLKQYISQTCDCTVTDCMDLHPESELEPDNTTAQRVERCLKNYTFVLVLYTSGCYNNSATSFDTDFYSCFLKAAVYHRQRHNDIRIVPLDLPFNISGDVPSVITTNSIQPVKVSATLDKVYCKIHAVDKEPSKRKNLHCETLSHWRDILTGLTQIIRQVQNNATIQRESEPLLHRTYSVNEHTVQNKQESHEDFVKPNTQDCFKQIAMFNEENDSVIGSLNRKSVKPKVRPSQEYAENHVSKHNLDNGKIQLKGKPGESEPMLESYKKDFEQSEGNATGKHKRSNIQIFEAEVHYSGENYVKSYPLANGRLPVHHKDQPLSLPTHIPYHPHNINTMQQIPHRELEFENPPPCDISENGNHSVGRSEFSPVMNFNMENIEDSDGSTVDDISEAENGQDVQFTNAYQRSPLLNGNLHHRPFFGPNGVLSHRNLGHPENHNHSENNFNDFQPDNLFDHRNMHYMGNAVRNQHFNEHATNYRPHHSRGMTHQQISNHGHCGSNHYQPDDFICYRDTFQMDHIHRRFPHNHQDLPHPFRHLNETDQYSVSPPAHEQSMHKVKNERRLPPQRISFDALDPPKAEQKDTAPVLDVKQKYEHAERNTADLLKVSSVQSLPSDIGAGTLFDDRGVYDQFSPPEDFHNYSCEPPHDFDNYSCEPPHDFDMGWQSKIMDELVAINRNNT